MTRLPGVGSTRCSSAASVGEHRRLHALVLAKAAGALTATAEAFHLRWSRRRRRHQATARWHHYQRHLRLALDPG